MLSRDAFSPVFPSFLAYPVFVGPFSRPCNRVKLGKHGDVRLISRSRLLRGIHLPANIRLFRWFSIAVGLSSYAPGVTTIAASLLIQHLTAFAEKRS